MQEGSNLNNQFKEYLKEKEGQEIDPKFAEEMRAEMERGQAEEEMEMGKRSGYGAHTSEASIETKPNNLPESTLDQTNLTIEELQLQLLTLEMAKNSIMALIQNSVHKKKFQITRETTLGTLEKMDTGSFQAIWNKINATLIPAFHEDTAVLDLLDEIKERTVKDTKILRHLEEKGK